MPGEQDMDQQWWQPGPEHLNFACALAGVEPVPLDRPFSFLGLDCGQELALAAAAGANPHGSYFVAGAAAGQAAGLPPMDFIILACPFSWLDRQQRQQAVELFDRCLKPGGIAYAGYDALPGCSSILPLQRLVREQARLHGDDAAQQLAQAAAQVEQLRGAAAAYFADNDTPAMRRRLAGIAPGCREFARRGWEALYHADVARALADAKLEYVASADLWWSDPRRHLPAAQCALLDAQGIPVLRETVRDVLLDTAFRRDIYVRGARRMHPMRQAEWLAGCYLDLAPARGKAPAQALDAALSGAMLDALAGGPRSFAELALLPALQGKDMLDVARLAGLLVDAGQALICNQGA
ncbi:methyltransferase regulatory domain-containing protein [Pseudoduganella sp. HUAS MS19]